MRLSRGWGRAVRGWSAWRLPGGGGWASPGRLGDTSGAWHLLILATDQTAHGATGRMAVGSPRHNLHRGEEETSSNRVGTR